MLEGLIERWIFRYAIALMSVGIVAALVVSPSSEASLPRAPGSSTTATPPTTTTTVPSLFPPVAADGPVTAIRTATGVVVPVTGGGPGAWQVLTPCSYETIVDGTPLHGANLVLDPGHGGSEVGAVGPSGLTEAALNLDVARRAAIRLEAAGAVVVLTRAERHPHDPADPGGHRDGVAAPGVHLRPSQRRAPGRQRPPGQ